MKRILALSVCVLLGIVASANADIIGSWASSSSSDNLYNIYTLQVTPTAGETMKGCNIKVSNSKSASHYYYNEDTESYTVTSTGLAKYSHFLFSTSGVTPSAEVTSASVLQGAYAITGTTGMYGTGWTSALNVLQIASLKTSGLTIGDLTVANTSDSLAMGYVLTGNNFAQTEIKFVPEPGTLALLASGLIGLVCYAWRKRK